MKKGMEEKRNEVLIRELYKEMEAELNKDAEQMDTDKIREINMVLDRLEGKDGVPKSLDKEQFLKEFDQKYGYQLSKKKSPNYWKGMAAACVLVVLAIGAGNTLAVKAWDKSLWQLVKENSYNIYYQTSDVKEEKLIESAEEATIMYSSWEEAGKEAGLALLSPRYLPDGMEESKVEKEEMGDIIRFSAFYENEDAHLYFFCEYSKYRGVYVKDKRGKKHEFENTQLGGRIVKMCQDDAIYVNFEEDNVLYMIDTTVEVDELEKFIKNLI